MQSWASINGALSRWGANLNRCFSPSDEEIAEARKIVDAFAAHPDAGTLGIDGKMYDIPHLKAALKTLAAAGEPA